MTCAFNAANYHLWEKFRPKPEVLPHTLESRNRCERQLDGLLLEDMENLTGQHLPLSSLRFAPAIGEDMPFVFVNFRRVGAEVVARPPRLIAEQHGPDVRFRLPHAMDVFPTPHRLVEVGRPEWCSTARSGGNGNRYEYALGPARSL